MMVIMHVEQLQVMDFISNQIMATRCSLNVSIKIFKKVSHYVRLYFYKILENPLIFLTIGTSLISQSSITNLTYGNTYQFSCISQNSRPSAALSIYANGINLNSYFNSTI